VIVARHDGMNEDPRRRRWLSAAAHARSHLQFGLSSFEVCLICPIGGYRKRSSSRMSGVARSRLAEERKAWRKVC